MKKTTLAQVLLKIHNFVGKDEEPILTGSNALRVFGLLDFERESSEESGLDHSNDCCAVMDAPRTSDVDIVLVNPKPETVELLRNLQELIPANTKPVEDSVYSKLIAILQIEIDGVKIKVDIFSEGENYLKHVTEATFAGHRVASIKSLIFKKRSYKRSKDNRDLEEWSRIFYDHKSAWRERIDTIFGI